MWIRSFALLVLLASSAIGAAPPDAPTPVEEIDVDAMARAKDVKADGEAVSPPPATDATAAVAEPQAQADEGVASDTAGADAAAAEPEDVAGAPTGDADTGEADATQADAAAPEAATPAAVDAPAADTPAAERRLADACTARANALLDAAQKQDYEKATRDFDAKMRTALPVPKFREAWQSLAQFGALEARGQPHPATLDGYIAVTIPLVFDKANLYAQVACGSDGRIAGFYVKPLQLPSQ